MRRCCFWSQCQVTWSFTQLRLDIGVLPKLSAIIGLFQGWWRKCYGKVSIGTATKVFPEEKKIYNLKSLLKVILIRGFRSQSHVKGSACYVTHHFLLSLCPRVTFYKTLMSLSAVFIKGHIWFLELLKWPCRTSFFIHVEPYVTYSYSDLVPFHVWN